MKGQKILTLSVILCFLATLNACLYSRTEANKEILLIPGLIEPVEIIKDHWGISHVFAQNQKDLFFAQGFNVARDRLFQLEIWRRQATGTLAEILGEKALNRDIGARLLKARVDMKKELNHYHPQGQEIITSFVRGINAYIDFVKQNPDLLPLEFQLLGIKPEHWTPEVVVSRHNGLFRNCGSEISMARTVSVLGADKTENLMDFNPSGSGLKVESGVDLSLISREILELYYASRSRVRFAPEDIADSSSRVKQSLAHLDYFLLPPLERIRQTMDLGSNNWVVSGKITATGLPIMANDPHRSQQIPSLRYWVHLVAPDWNVIGGGEPALPGVSIGHNEHGAWGLTIFAIDQEDLYVYETNPANPNQYLYQGKWEEMNVIQESIHVKDRPSVTADLKFTMHGPVLYEDKSNHKAFALRAAWLEIGGAPYLASLRMDQAKNWEEFREACSYSHTPSENMVWADVQGNIGWQAVGITPLRKNWNGLLPVPGDGQFEWEGYLPIQKLPHVYNPEQGFFATANQYNVPERYPHILGLQWSAPFRFLRIKEFLSAKKKLTLKDMMDLQQDELSLPARTFVPLLKRLHSEEARIQKAMEMLLAWDYVMDKDSIPAAIYTSWVRRLMRNVWEKFIPEKARKVFSSGSREKMIGFLNSPDEHFGPEPAAGRDSLLLQSLEEGISDLVERLGPDMNKWQYGQEKFHHVTIRHMLSRAVNEELRAKLDVGPLPRGGNSFTVNNTSSGYNQTSGASFRIIADLSDWDKSLGTNSPGQSGNPNSPHYADLFEMWARGDYFPVYFSRKKVESAAEQTTVLKPKK
ncbi:MAG: penicillin acylase family protein [Candidatus Aminicenantes bacterium]|nr:MAG: penicillin acylase family protein [Candidatus Aminicenantes bacterium]